ncbi:flagellar biosynthesis protein FliO [Pseudarthrobacter chlorophenolicus A6]|uniref:Flagellar protein n=1 Tax=Pseudarthrobacter chlorophenolicus (strain ATCC 700700 / DSM 12829 / CIP 107037 / JCM 12360 / KCTC 9906 / NCIMB 13794 / A6) TaxID=452863 RepID=B8HEJ3_PSECP|nr:flagellar biosynthetic protein FliO [Pseudarthrobacter chlorophenolicus]ACL40938.1 flagellar biosynthesis protein FliO [Pseudarthrobacter chlorophenolicus A6]SDQ72547.1 flagellar protein FliO/FliZ [Pseudarthrobacter chlorophenolicus]
MDSLILGLRVLVALGAVLGLMWYLQRRVTKAKGHGRRRANRTLSVVSRQSVGQKASVVVIDAGDKRFLLGVTEHSINVLHSGDIPAEALEAAGGPAEERTTAAQRPALPARPPRVVTAPAATSGAEGFAAVFQEAAGMPRRADLHRRVASSSIQTSRLHGSLLAGSTWRQAAEAFRGRRT